MLPRRALAAPLAAAALVAACSSVQTTRPGAVGVDRQQLMSPLVSEAQLTQGAAQAYQQVIGQARTKGQLNRDGRDVQRVRGIAQRLIPHTAVFRPDAPKWKWETNVIESEEVNAWAMPGGKIAVYTGIIDKLKLTDDELAAIMGHEIAHALREHGRERASQAATQGLAVSVIGAATGVGGLGQQMAEMALQVTFGLPNSRVQETEADRMGVELAARAGYDPRAAVTLWEKMGRLSEGSASPRWLSTHPTHADRIADLRVYAQKVMPLYQQARR